MTTQELLFIVDYEKHWKIARDRYREIIEDYTQAYPVNGKMPDETDVAGWVEFLKIQSAIYQYKIINFARIDCNRFNFSCIVACSKYGYYPPHWLLLDWLMPGFLDYSKNIGKKSLEESLGISGKQKKGNILTEHRRSHRDITIYSNMIDLINATELSIDKCAQILSMKVGFPSHNTIATIYKKINSMMKKHEEQITTGMGKELNKLMQSFLVLNTNKQKTLKEVFNLYGDLFLEAAHSSRHDIAVTTEDYDNFVKKLE